MHERVRYNYSFHLNRWKIEKKKLWKTEKNTKENGIIKEMKKKVGKG